MEEGCPTRLKGGPCLQSRSGNKTGAEENERSCAKREGPVNEPGEEGRDRRRRVLVKGGSWQLMESRESCCSEKKNRAHCPFGKG